MNQVLKKLKRMKKSINSNQGFVLIEVLIALSIMASLMSPTLSILNVLQQSFERNQLVQDQVSINQLRHTLLLSNNIQYFSDHIEFDYHDKDCSLGLLNNKLIMKPGTMIYLIEIDDVLFLKDQNALILQYQRGSNVYQKVIAYLP